MVPTLLICLLPFLYDQLILFP